VLVERSTHPQFVSNTYLVADGRGGPAFFVDAGGPVGPLIEAAERHGLVPTHLLLTHHHFDHVSEAPVLLERWPELAVLAGERELSLARDGGQAQALAGAQPLEPGARLSFGELTVEALATPGHTSGMLSFLTHDPGSPDAVFTGDTLFKASVGGVRAPGHSTYADLRSSIMDTLMGLAPETVIHPGHAQDTTVAAEWEQNPFIRIWRGVDPEGTSPCTALDEPATLVLLARDYDGGNKAWVRWPDGSDDIVPGSRVQASG
jgi:glyoxylase-like metal-dependent hydrolase (beta-lactamase superfamily II)